MDITQVIHFLGNQSLPTIAVLLLWFKIDTRLKVLEVKVDRIEEDIKDIKQRLRELEKQDKIIK